MALVLIGSKALAALGRATGNRYQIRNAPADVRDFIFQRDGNQCVYCGAKLGNATRSIDHVIPYKLFPRTTLDNLVTACIACNSDKAGRIDVDYLAKGLRYLLPLYPDSEFLTVLLAESTVVSHNCGKDIRRMPLCDFV